MDGQRYRVLISDKARQMMKAHVSFLAEVNPQAAEKLRVSLMEGIRSLAQMPERCPYLDEEIGGVHIENCIYPNGIWLYTL